jgi:hypothetical protein
MEVNLPFFEGARVAMPDNIIDAVSLKEAVNGEGLSLKELLLDKKDYGFYHEKNHIRPQDNVQAYSLYGKVPADRRAKHSLMAYIHFDLKTRMITLNNVNPLLARGRLLLRLDLRRREALSA